jgi:Flp pilus assembly pilin Flp
MICSVLQKIQLLLTAGWRGAQGRDSGASIYEYALLLVLVLVVALEALTAFGHGVTHLLNNSGAAINNA